MNQTLMHFKALSTQSDPWPLLYSRSVKHKARRPDPARQSVQSGPGTNFENKKKIYTKTSFSGLFQQIWINNNNNKYVIYLYFFAWKQRGK